MHACLLSDEGILALNVFWRSVKHVLVSKFSLLSTWVFVDCPWYCSNDRYVIRSSLILSGVRCFVTLFILRRVFYYSDVR